MTEIDFLYVLDIIIAVGFAAVLFGFWKINKVLLNIGEELDELKSSKGNVKEVVDIKTSKASSSNGIEERWKRIIPSLKPENKKGGRQEDSYQK